MSMPNGLMPTTLGAFGLCEVSRPDADVDAEGGGGHEACHSLVAGEASEFQGGAILQGNMGRPRQN